MERLRFTLTRRELLRDDGDEFYLIAFGDLLFVLCLSIQANFGIGLHPTIVHSLCVQRKSSSFWNPLSLGLVNVIVQTVSTCSGH